MNYQPEPTIEDVENSIKLAQMEHYLISEHIKALEVRSLAERQWITELSIQVSGEGGPTATAISFTQAIKGYYEIKANLLRVDLGRKQAEVMVLQAKLEHIQARRLTTN